MPACGTCTDLVCDFADASFGYMGSAKDLTTTIVRTSQMEEIIQDLLKKEIIEEGELQLDKLERIGGT